jgi:hypothetical protein
MRPDFILLEGPSWANENETYAGCVLRVSGSAVAGPDPACALEPAAEFDYFDVQVGSWSDLTLTIRNQTPDLLTTNQFRYLLENPTTDCRLSTIDPADTAGVIGPGESRDIVVRFAPDAGDSFECARSLASLKEPADPADPDIANACPATVTWRGTGVIGAPVWSNCAPGGNSDYRGVFGLSGSEVYVAGDAGVVLASDGNCQWAASGTGFADVNLTDIWAYSDGASKAIWVVGNIPPPPGTYSTTGAILRSDGAQWEEVDEGWIVTYGAVWGSGLDDVYFGGLGVSTDFPNAKHWNGSVVDTLHMSEMGMSPVTGVRGTASNDVWAVLGQSWNPVFRFQGVQWASQSQAFMTKPLHDVWAVQGTGFYAVYAVGEDGAIFHFDGTHWADESIPGSTACK